MAEIANNSIDIQVVETGGENAQYFWHNTTDSGAGEGAGAHITEVPKDDFIADPDAAGGNTLINSRGMQIRNGTAVIADFSNNVELFTEEGVSAFSVDTGVVSETTSIRQYLSGIDFDIELNYSESYTVDALDDAANSEDFVFSYYFKYESNDNVKQYASTVRFTKGTSETKTKSHSYIDAAFTVEFAYDGNKTITITITTFTSGEWAPQYFWVYAVRYNKTVHRAEVNIDGNLTVSKDVTFLSPADVFVVETAEIPTTSISGNTAAEFDMTVSKSGYYPVGVVGFSCVQGTLVARRMYIDTQAVGSCRAVANVRNASSSAAGASRVNLNILWVKAE